MQDRKVNIEYKGVEITGYKGSNWAYIGDRPFMSFVSAKRHITKVTNHCNGDIEKVKEFYELAKSWTK